MIQIKRVYDPPGPNDGRRYLVDRLWPRGCKKENLKLDGWMRNVAPSDSLRQRYQKHPEQWEEFKQAYCRELEANPEAWKPLIDVARQGTVTLLYAKRDPVHNNASVLRDFLLEKITLEQDV